MLFVDMRRISIACAAFVVVACAACTTAQELGAEARKYLQQALDTMKEHALHSKETDWKVLTEQTFLKAEHAQLPSDTYAAIIYACAQLRKFEACFLSLPDETTIDARKNVSEALLANAPRARHGMSLVPSPFVGRKEPQLSLLQAPKGKTWAYLVVPQCKPSYTDAAKNEPSLAAWVAALRFFIIEAYGANGWIVDLRGNEGGNTWAPMVALA